MDIRELLRKALQDQVLNIDILVSNNYQQIKEVIARLSRDECISEWKHTNGGIRYEYHIHRDETARVIAEAYDAGIRGGNPRLVGVYSKEKLEDLIGELSKV